MLTVSANFIIEGVHALGPATAADHVLALALLNHARQLDGDQLVDTVLRARLGIESRGCLESSFLLLLVLAHGLGLLAGAARTVEDNFVLLLNLLVHVVDAVALEEGKGTCAEEHEQARVI